LPAPGAVADKKHVRQHQGSSVIENCASKASAAKKKLTEQQKQGLNLLESAEATAGGFEAPSRIGAFGQIARSYQAIDKEKAIDLLQRAYDSFRTVEFDSADQNLNGMVRGQLQQQLLYQFADVAPERLDSLIDQMEPSSRVSALRVLQSYYEKTKNLDRPITVLLQLGLEGEMPYGIVDDLIDKLGPGHLDEIRQLFFTSVASYQRRQHSEINGSTDFANLIARAYGKVPDNAVESAIDELLSQARKSDEENRNVTVTMGFDKGAVQFKSIYECQLFAVLPTLEQVDPEKAKRLLKESSDVTTFASKYSQGMNSLSKTGRARSISTYTGDSAGVGARSSEMLEHQQLNAITKDAQEHPNDALANAAGLSTANAILAYLEIARVNVKKNSAVAKAALAKAQELLPRVSLQDRMNQVVDLVSIYEQLGDKEDAQKAIELGAKTGAELYNQERDAEDPNLAPKAFWVSTNAWRSLVNTGFKLDQGLALTLLKEAPDDEIRVFAQIALARRLMGHEAAITDFTMSMNKKGWWVNVMTLE